MDSRKVMIVEDNATVAEDCRFCLISLGYHVTSIVAAGEEAIERAEVEHPDVVLMDIHLRDEIDGIEAAAQIYSRFGIPVVFLSAYSDRNLLERAKPAGSFGYLVKPFGERELFATIEMALHKANSNAAELATARMEATATLAGGIAHDYNNLMQIVQGNAELMQSSLGIDHPEVKSLQAIIEAAHKASRLANRLLAFARGGAYNVEKTDLNLVVQEVLQAQQRIVPGRVRILCDLETKPWSIKADRSQLSIVLASVCSNAVEAIEGEGEIRITTQNVQVDAALAQKHSGLNPGKYILLNVEDTGCGMAPEVLIKVFEPFFTTRFQGRGLGLAADYGIVKNHKGDIVVQSVEGKGTTCTIYIPTVESEIKEQPKPQAVTAAKVTETILVVDDEEELLELISLILKYPGYKVLTANSGQTAIDIARQHEGDIHLALLDMGMPVIDGPAAFPFLREARPDMKILLFSGFELDTDAQGLLDAGACGFLMKPISPGKLREEIREVLDSGR